MKAADVFKTTSKGLLCALRVTPNAGDNKLHGLIKATNGLYTLKLSVTATPEKGKANKAVIKVLSKILHLPKTSMEIVSGQTSRNKILLIDVNPDIAQDLATKLDIKRF